MYNTIDEVYEARRNGEIDIEEFQCLVDAFNDNTEEAFKAKQRGEISAVEFYSLVFRKAYRELQEEKQRSALNEYQQ